VIAVAVLLLPALWVLLVGMDRLEERLLGGAEPDAPREDPEPRRLRLVTGDAGTDGAVDAAGENEVPAGPAARPRRLDAA
jgi:hypothetical protein